MLEITTVPVEPTLDRIVFAPLGKLRRSAAADTRHQQRRRSAGATT
jgi:hypothetical protein